MAVWLHGKWLEYWGVMALCLVLCSAANGSAGISGKNPPVAPWPPHSFPIGLWCSPPEPYITVEQYRRIADAGFTLLLPPCEGEATVRRNHKILDTAKLVGLQVLVQDARMPHSVTGNPNADGEIKAIVNEYRKHPALLGYFLVDEPGADSFAGLAEVSAALRKFDPDHLVYINLFPNYATTNRTAIPSQLHTNTYDEYLDQFVSTVSPQVLSWDHYFALTPTDRAGFFGNLYSGQRAAMAAQPPIPFWQIVMAVKHGPYRALTPTEILFEAMQTLAYGAQGLVYFTYWLPPDDASTSWSEGITNRDGTPGPLYEPVKAVNSKVRLIAKWLFGAVPVRTFQSGTIPLDGVAGQDDIPVHVTGPGDLTVGMFRGTDGYAYVLVTNRDTHKAVTTQLKLGIGTHVVERLQIVGSKWAPADVQKDRDEDTLLKLTVDPGDGILLRWQ